MINVILCGGSGTRLWPLSRELYPKQFLKIINRDFCDISSKNNIDTSKNISLFQKTAILNQQFCSDTLVVSNQSQYFLALDNLTELNIEASYILEPCAKNTAPAIALCAMSLHPDEIMLVCPSDHLINDEKLYAQAIVKAVNFAQNNSLVVFGITPISPETGFGYIKSNGDDVIKFCEKPNLELAKQFLKSGEYFWNSGIFCFKAGVFLDELKLYSPDLYEAVAVSYAGAIKGNPLKIPLELMDKIPAISLDYALMEKTKNAKIVKANFKWSDVGSFESLAEIFPQDENQNNIYCNLLDNNSRHNFIHAPNKKVALIDIEDLIIIDTKDALVISKKQSSSKIKEVVEYLKKQNDSSVFSHLSAYRPWGSYTILEQQSGYKIKKITVKPGKKLSLQKHYHRNEHWIILSGTASVTVDDKSYLVRPNESTYIKMGQVHRLSNEGKIPVVLIEVQVGEYTNEDDIKRLVDDFM